MAENKPDIKDTSMCDDNIQVGVQDTSGQVTQFKIKMKTPLRKLMSSYCTRKQIGMDAVRFLLDGVRLQPHKCPGDYDMQAGDTLEVFQEQQGGAGVRLQVSHKHSGETLQVQVFQEQQGGAGVILQVPHKHSGETLQVQVLEEHELVMPHKCPGDQDMMMLDDSNIELLVGGGFDSARDSRDNAFDN